MKFETRITGINNYVVKIITKNGHLSQTRVKYRQIRFSRKYKIYYI